MSPSLCDNRRQKGKSCHNASLTKDRKCSEEDLDKYSVTTSSTQPASEDDDRRPSMRNDRNQGKQLLGMMAMGSAQKNMLPPPPPPAAAPPRTRLKSAASLFVPKTALASVAQAPMFVPGGGVPAPTVAPAPVASGPSEGKDCLANIIQCTLGSELWNLSMVDCHSFTGEMYTAVDITIPALSASMCHLSASQDADAIAAGQQATQFQACQSLLQTFQSLSPKVTIEPSPEPSQLSVKYCASDRDMLCWEFSHKGFCPRYQTCRWAHAIVETFVINLILQPLTQGYMQPGNAPQQQQQQQQYMHPANAPQAVAPQMLANEPPMEPPRWVPMRPPMMANDEISPCSAAGALPMLNMNSYAKQDPDKASAMLEDPDDTPWPNHIKDISFGTTTPGAEQPQPVKTDTKERTLTSRRAMTSRKNWADIQEESDDEPYMLPTWSAG